jgi:hypothetical protein
MLVVRRHLRRFVLLWLCSQVASVSAFVPATCCDAHGPLTASTPECHGPADGVCPMHAGTGEECPMKDGAPDCAMRGLCNAPASALSVLIPLPGILATTTVAHALQRGADLHHLPTTTLERTSSNDPPPPRI